MEWEEYALCKTSEANFFPSKGESPRLARLVCRRCEVKTECLQMALDEHINFGVYGGTVDKQRRLIRRIGLSAEQAIDQGFVR